MKYFATIASLYLIAFSLYIGSYGCASQKNEISSSRDETKGALQVKEQGVCVDAKSGKMWQRGRGGVFSSVQEAEHYAANLQLGGYDDWRLPTTTELFRLYYIFYWKKNGDCTMNRSGEYWALEEGRVTTGHWESYILCGPEHKYVKSLEKNGYVRAVRP